MNRRPTPRERLYAALAYGIRLKPSGEMNWTANCETRTSRPQESQTFNMIFAADSEADAARFAAEAAARRVYGDQGVAGVIQTRNAPLYVAAIGIRNKLRLNGCSVSILIRRYTHPVTGK